MLRSAGRISTQTSLPSQDPVSSTTSEVRRLNSTRSLRPKSEATTRPRRTSAQKGLAGATPPDIDIVISNGKVSSRVMNQPSNSIIIGAFGIRRSLDSPNQHQNFNETASNHTASDYGFPPISEHLSSREKQQSKHMEEFDTIVVRGKDTVGTIRRGTPQPISQNSSVIAPSPVGKRRGSRNNAIGALSGGNSGRSSSNSDGRSVIGTNSSLRRIKTSDDPKSFTGSATGHLESPTLSGSRDAARMSQLPRSLPQYSQPTITTVAPSGMEYNVSTQENSANVVPSGPQEGIMKMEAESNSTPQWSETKTKVPPSIMCHHYAES